MQVTHKPLGTKGGLPGLKIVQRPCFEQHSSGRHRQHNNGGLYKQTEGDEVLPSVCPSVENPDPVNQETGNSQSSTQHRPAERDSRQAIQPRPDHSNGMAPSPRGVPSYMLQMAAAQSGLVCQFVSPIPEPQAWTVDAPSLYWDDLGPYAFPRANILIKVVDVQWPCPVRFNCVCPGCPIW